MTSSQDLLFNLAVESLPSPLASAMRKNGLTNPGVLKHYPRMSAEELRLGQEASRPFGAKMRRSSIEASADFSECSIVTAGRIGIGIGIPRGGGYLGRGIVSVPCIVEPTGQNAAHGGARLSGVLSPTLVCIETSTLDSHDTHHTSTATAQQLNTLTTATARPSPQSFIAIFHGHSHSTHTTTNSPCISTAPAHPLSSASVPQLFPVAPRNFNPDFGNCAAVEKQYPGRWRV